MPSKKVKFCSISAAHPQTGSPVPVCGWALGQDLLDLGGDENQVLPPPACPYSALVSIGPPRACVRKRTRGWANLPTLASMQNLFLHESVTSDEAHISGTHARPRLE
jgi:hypothetical protein